MKKFIILALILCSCSATRHYSDYEVVAKIEKIQEVRRNKNYARITYQSGRVSYAQYPFNFRVGDTIKFK